MFPAMFLKREGNEKGFRMYVIDYPEMSVCVCVCVCVRACARVCACQRKTKDRADGMREKSSPCPRRDSNLYLWDTRP